MAKKKDIPQITTFGEFENLFLLLKPTSRVDCLKVLNKAEKPVFIFEQKVADNLNLIDFGTYSDLCDIIAEKDQFVIIKKIAKALFDVTDDDIRNSSAYDMWGLSIWAIGEITRINELFNSIKVEYTDQEKKAGIDKLQFGTFGILDWYAKRMGIHDQNEVNKEKWVRIWQCMKNDAEETAYNRRLQKVYEQESKYKH